MSYILDALEKSEQERFQGQMQPFAAGPGMVKKPKRRAGWYWFAGGLVTVNLAVVGWLLWSGKEQAAGLAEPLQTVIEEAGDLSGETALSRDINSGDSGSVSPDTEIQSLASPGPVYADRAPAGQAGYAADVARPVQPASAGLDQPVTAIDSERISPDWGQGEDLIPDNGQGRYTYIDSEEGLYTVVRPQQPRLAQPEQPATVSPQYPRASELAAGIRNRLPPLNYSGHIWSSQPDSCRITLNGQEVREGGMVSGVQVTEILADGVVLAFEGTRFKLDAMKSWYP